MIPAAPGDPSWLSTSAEIAFDKSGRGSRAIRYSVIRQRAQCRNEAVRGNGRGQEYSRLFVLVHEGSKVDNR
jgi:hypothetical protein